MGLNVFILGIDGGGTTCRAALATDDGTVIGRAKAGSANIRTDLTGARTAIVEAARAAFLDSGKNPAQMSQACAVLGLAGANVGSYAQQLAAILPFKKSRVETDALIALEGAIGSGDGAMAILGTGTAYLARRGGELHAVGGWGFLIGDQGSGARIGRDLLEEALLAHDRIIARTPLTDAIVAVFRNEPGDVVEFTKSAKPGDFGGFAPMVFEHAESGDATALRILDRARHAIEASLDALPIATGAPLCLLGGLAPAMEPRLSPRFRNIIKPPQTDALGGAVSMASRLFGKVDG